MKALTPVEFQGWMYLAKNKNGIVFILYCANGKYLSSTKLIPFNII